ncbi:MAG: hypothetical protein GEU82_02220 [Luteitalea sp.]|nr:hypothetical protein [Luteitalea sp.]
MTLGRSLAAVGVLTGFFVCPRAAAQDAVAAAPLDQLLERAGDYVSAFQAAFTHVVGVERYRQEVHAPGGGDMADLESEVFFVGLDDRRTWLTIRHVLSVNGRSVADSGGSVIDLLAERGGRARLRELADAGAQYNIGSLQRNFNDPMLALQFLGRESQKRFRFRHDGGETVNGIPAHRVAFDERERPTIIRDARSRRDVPASGVLIIDDDGTVLRSELGLQAPRRTQSKIRVTFEHEPRVEMMVPRLMEEEYRTAGSSRSREVITCRATYSNYRRFETGGRIIIPEAAQPNSRWP